MIDVAEHLRRHGIQASAHRVAVASYVLETDEHPSADRVWKRVSEAFPQISRATVYNSLNLFVEKGLLRQFVLSEGRAVFDPHTDAHHHFIDEETGEIVDLPWEALDVRQVGDLGEFDVDEVQVVLRGRRRTS